MKTIKCTRCNGMGEYEGFGTCFKCNGYKVIAVSEKEYQEYIKYNENCHKSEDTRKSWEQQVKERNEKKHAERMSKVAQINATQLINKKNIEKDFNLLDFLD